MAGAGIRRRVRDEGDGDLATVILHPDAPAWKGSRPNSTGGVCGPCGFRLPDDFATMADDYTCPNCRAVFEGADRTRRRRSAMTMPASVDRAELEKPAAP